MDSKIQVSISYRLQKLGLVMLSLMEGAQESSASF